MPLDVDTTKWSGEGTFTQVLIERLREVGAIRGIRVEDAPATRSEADYNFISNELFVEFATVARSVPTKLLGVLPSSRTVVDKAMTIPDLERVLTGLEEVGAPDYADEGMLQYLRTERVIPPYQTRGYKLVELVRIYEAGTPRR